MKVGTSVFACPSDLERANDLPDFARESHHTSIRGVILSLSKRRYWAVFGSFWHDRGWMPFLVTEGLALCHLCHLPPKIDVDLHKLYHYGP